MDTFSLDKKCLYHECEEESTPNQSWGYEAACPEGLLWIDGTQFVVEQL